MDNVEMIRKYKELLDEGLITQEDFERKRDQLMSQPDEMQKPDQSIRTDAQQQVAAPQQPQTGNPQQQEASIGWGILGFFIPIVGLILFLVWKDTNPKASKYAGIGALVGVIITVISYVIITVAATASMY